MRIAAAGSATLALATVLFAGTAFGAESGSTDSSAAADPDRPCVVETPDATAPAGFQPLKICASFDRTAYRSSDVVKLTVSVTNVGSGTAKNVFLEDGLGGSFRTDHSGLFVQQNRDIRPGATATSEMDGYAGEPDTGVVRFTDGALQGPGPEFQMYGDPVSISAPVTPVIADYGGVVSADQNGNGKPDPGEGLANVKVTLSGPFQGIDGDTHAVDHTATTDAQGRFLLSKLPGGQYFLRADAPGGWVVHSKAINVDGSTGQTDESYLATRPLSETLHVTMAFDQPSYHVGEQAHLTVRLSNSGSTAITGIKIGCNHVGDTDVLTGDTPGWGPLVNDGVTVGAGQTVTVHVSQVVPVGALAHGKVWAECVFGPDPLGDFTGYPDVGVSATALPAIGRTIDFTVQLRTAPENGTPDVLLRLQQPSTHDPIDWQFPSSTFSFKGIPDGVYDIVLVGSWQLAPGQASKLNTADIKSGSTVVVDVVPGQSTLPPPTGGSTPPPTGPSSTGQPTSSTTSAAPTTTTAAAAGGSANLPFTGVSVVWPVLGALLLIGLGIGAVLIARRRATG